MPVDITCPCGEVLRVSDPAGSRVRCPACGAVHTVPAPGHIRPAVVAGETDPPIPRVPVVDTPEARLQRQRDDRHARREERDRRAQRQVSLGCGSLAVVVGIGLIVYVRVTDDPGALKVMIVAGLMTIFGAVGVTRALLGTTPDDAAESLPPADLSLPPRSRHNGGE